MKKDRNSFFPNFGNQPNNFAPNNNFFPNQNMNQMPGTYNPNMVPEQMYPYGYMPNDEDFEIRINRVEKMIKKLNSRITKLESKNNLLIDDDDITSSSNMYMI